MTSPEHQRMMVPDERMQLLCQGCNWEFEIISYPVQSLDPPWKDDLGPVRTVKICPNCGCSSLTIL